MYENFDYNVDRNDERTIISVTKCRFITALFLLGKFREKFGRWTSGTDIKLFGKDTMTNAGCSIEVRIPHSKNPRYTKNPFTKEYVSGYFAGLREFLCDADRDDIMKVISKEVGIT